MGRRSSRSRPCPVCGDTKARCKVHDEGDRIWCRSILDKHSPLLGGTWRWAAALTGGPGGSVIIRKAADEEKVAHRPRARRQRKPKEKPKASPAARADDATEKFLAYQRERSRKLRALVAGRTLSEDDKERLRLRGIDSDDMPALEEVGMVSIQEGDVVLAAAGAPGVDDRGNYTGPTGFLIPAYRPTADGGIEYLGMQIATCDVYKDTRGGKYIWLSMGTEAEGQRSDYALQVMADDGSLDSAPLFSHIGGDTVEMAFLCDGALKTYVTALRQKQAAFGAPGAMFSTSMGQLRDGLRRVVGLNGRVKIAVAPDAADPGNRLIMEQLAATANCVREWGYQIDWVDLQQEKGKGIGKDIDETDVAVEELIEQEVFFQKMSAGVRKEVRRGLARRWENGFRPMKPCDQLEPQLNTETPVLYKKGQRTQALANLLAQGHRLALDASATGAGKSHWWAHLDAKDLEALNVDQVAVLSERYLEQADEFDVGMVRGRQGQGVKRTDQGRLFTVQYGEELAPDEFLEHGSNCNQGAALAKFQSRNMAISLGSLCTCCEYRDACETMTGAYRYERANALLEPVVVMHPKSMQEQFVLQQKEEDGPALSRTGVVLDDVALEQLLETVTVNPNSIKASLAVLETPLKNKNGIRELLGLCASQRAKNPRELRDGCLHELRTTVPKTVWGAVIEEEERMVDQSDGRAGLRCWLPYLKAWVAGQAVAHVDIAGNLVFKVINGRLRDALNSAAWVLFLDATASPMVLGKLMGEEPQMIAEERWLTPADLRVKQIKGLGILGYRRSAQQEFQIKVALGKMKKSGLLPYESTAIIDTKAGLEISKHFGVVSMGFLSDSRGSNRAYEARCTTLGLIGSPNTNLANAASTYELLFQETVDLEARRPVIYPVMQEDGAEPMVCCEIGSQHPGFSQFYAHLRRAELLQALGRLRHNIREGEVLNVIVLGDTLMPFPVQLVELSEVIDDDNMADWQSCNDKTLGAAAWSLKSEGKTISIEAIAQATGLHPTLVGEWVQAFQPSWMPGCKQAEAPGRRPRSPRTARRQPRTRRQKQQAA